MVFDFCLPSVLKYIENNSEKQWRCGTSLNFTETVPGKNNMLVVFVFDDKSINYQRIWLKFSQFIKH